MRKPRFIMKKIRTMILLFVSSMAVWSASTVHAATVMQTFDFNSIGINVPDGIGTGVVNVRSVASAIQEITDLSVSLHLSGGAAPGFTGINGDLYAYVQHDSGFAVLLNRPGMDGTNPFGYFDPGGINVVFDDLGVNGDVHHYQDEGIFALSGPLTGTFQPDGRNIDSLFSTPAAVNAAPRVAMLSTFDGLDASGNWTLYVEDMFGDGSQFVLESWSLHITGNDSLTTVPEPKTALPVLIVGVVAGLRRAQRRRPKKEPAEAGS